MKSEAFSPKAFLKTRRPEQFSDTIDREEAELDRSLLEYHLSSLTSRSQEADFERFAHRLCQREICPNLLPQTGPTGGGDSKVDSETYPVAENLALTWYVGEGSKAARERWAFAFSTKARWRPKVQSDVKKITETTREYKKAFFVTSQSVRDRKRAEVEDSLRSQYGIDVRILDRTWILDRVFDGRHEQIAVEELGITALTRRIVRKGAQDASREEELDRLEELIQEAVQAKHTSSSLVDKALEAADLARSLERPRAEVEGRFHRASIMAEKFGSSRQKVEAAYQWAWTLYWWFEDYDAFVEQYGRVEKWAAGSRNAHDLQRVSNLWLCFFSAVRHGKLDAESTKYDAHTENLILELQRLKKEEDRPSTALQAETQFIHIQMARRIASGEPINDLLDELGSVILQSKGLVGYPLETLVEILTEIGPVLEGSRAYDGLFETVVEVTSARDGEVRAAKLLLARGEQQIDQGRNIEAIATLGRALRLLYKHETRHALVRALYLCGYAYDAMGLPWAARGTLLSAASVATDEYWQYEDVTPYQAACYRLLKWVELFLGRLPYVLSWHELDVVVRHALAAQGSDPESLDLYEPEFDVFFGRLLLRTEFSDLRYLVGFPDLLDRLDLPLASDALLYALGHKERLEETCRELDDDSEHFATRWRNLNSNRPLPNQPELLNQRRIKLKSRILGCQIVVYCQNTPPCIEVSESFLAALESFLATSRAVGAIAREPDLTVDVRISHFAATLIHSNLEEQGGRPHIAVTCRSFDPHKVTLEEQGEIKEALLELTITALTRIILFRDHEQGLQALFDDERALERALDFTGTFRTQANVLGDTPKTGLDAWVEDSDQTYPLLREKPWEPQEVEMEKRDTEASQPTNLESPFELLDPNFFRHDQMEIVSLIRAPLWEQAEWSGVAFDEYPAGTYPPTFALVFKNRDAGREIFGHWRRALGEVDRQEQLRLTIVKGIDLHHPHAYRVIIGSNPELTPGNDRLVMFMCRTNTMGPASPVNLNRFLSAHAAADAFFLAPAFVPSDFVEGCEPEFEMDLAILVHTVHVREAWEIGPGDMDLVGVQEGDEPVIPEGIEKPPVLGLFGRHDDTP